MNTENEVCVRERHTPLSLVGARPRGRTRTGVGVSCSPAVSDGTREAACACRITCARHSSANSEVVSGTGTLDFDVKSVFGLIWHHGRAGARARAAESARLHGRAMGRFPSDRTEQNSRERPPCYCPRRQGPSKSRGPWAGRAVRGGNAGRANANAALAGLARHKNKLPT